MESDDEGNEEDIGLNDEVCVALLHAYTPKLFGSLRHKFHSF